MNISTLLDSEVGSRKGVKTCSGGRRDIKNNFHLRDWGLDGIDQFTQLYHKIWPKSAPDNISPKRGKGEGKRDPLEHTEICTR